MSQTAIELDKKALLDKIAAYEDHNTNDEFMSILLSAIVQSQLSGRPELCRYPTSASDEYKAYFDESLSYTLCCEAEISIGIIRQWIRAGNPHYRLRREVVRRIARYLRRDECQKGADGECCGRHSQNNASTDTIEE